MTNKSGIVIAVFNKDLQCGYRIRNKQGEEEWFLLDESHKGEYNVDLKNKQVDFDFLIIKDKKGRDRKVLTFIQEEEGVKEIKIENKEVFSHPQLKEQPQKVGGFESREMARDFAMIRQQAIQLTLELAKINGTRYDNFEELKDDSKKFEEYIRRGE